MNFSASTKPLLIYDGDCDFCNYSVRYWQKLTGDQVNYSPYQAVEQDYPQISREEFKRAVQYVAPDKKISSGAKASFQTISHAVGKRFWLWLYLNMPFFAFFSEKAYTFVSTHRSAFYRLALLLYGRHYEPPRYDLISWIFLRLLGLLFFSAFVSFGTQALGLIGSQGIIPVSELITAATNMESGIRYWVLPMLFWINSSDIFIQFVCWGGAVFSLLLVFNILPRLNLILLYLFYLSLVTAGQVFMSFQWDLFLLEAGILAIFLINFRVTGIWLLRWLLFRFMFAGAMVKLLSGDASWQAWTALYTYFATEPLPTPLAWYAHQLPHIMLQFATAATLVIEGIISFLIFFPRRLRFFAAFSFLLLQTVITLTGNYNFFNFLTMTLCLVLFDDAAIQAIVPNRLIHRIKQGVIIKPYRKVPIVFVTLFVIFTVFLSIVQFQERFVGGTPNAFIWLNDVASPWRIVGTYGPFAVITYPRNEIIIEGSEDGTNWREYEFKYKPGDIYREPLWNIPHQPRLDWQMWFAALSAPKDNPWFSRFLERILENSSTVLALLKDNPFPEDPPLYVRAQFYEYRFTNVEEKKETGAWWKRELINTYFPETRLRSLFDRADAMPGERR